MGSNEVLKVAIAEPSMIIRSGVAVVLKRIQGFRMQPIEIASIETLRECVRAQKPDLLVVNPAFLGYFDLSKFKEETGLAKMKCIALMCSVTDNSLVRNFDESVTMYDGPEEIREKLNKLLNTPQEEEVSGQDILSGREKEIVVCVVKGMTNKEIADMLFLSAHTVITHRRNIARKLQIHSSSGLTIYAILNKLVELQDIKDCLPKQ